MWYIYTVEFYLAVRKNEIMSFARKWMELEITILSELGSLTKTSMLCFFSHVEEFGVGEDMEVKGGLLGL
jgi:hypothetical protein